ncbi:MAG: TetR/AcrR family transcriptional regulator [Pseudomonadota bacterium]|nr:TetR/AcrR family transcriptional regulator [Pseudomonadota bacterium]
MEISAPSPSRRIGRPLSFDRDKALREAMMLFWRHGYEATSLSDLTRGLGVTPPSIYSAFGNKKGLFLEAVDLYLSGAASPAAIIDGADSARAAARALMEGAAVAFTGEDTPPGCMLATSAISVSDDAADVQAHLSAIRNAVEAHLRARIERDVTDGALPPETDAETLAAHTTAIIQGMSTLARDGASRDKLLRVARSAMSAWPQP